MCQERTAWKENGAEEGAGIEGAVMYVLGLAGNLVKLL